MRLIIAVTGLAFALSAGASTTVLERTLDNGLEVIVKPDRRAPIVTSQVWYRVGSSYEHGGLTGISHVLEHMMFKGTEHLEPGEFSRIIAANGGDENAFTGRDFTGYYQTMAADRIEVSFELEAERMRRLALPADEFAKEVEVVKEERRLRTDDDPEALTYEQFMAVAYAASPYRIPIIGWASDLDHLGVDDLRAWYRRWYAPSNATLVVVGDVDPEAVFALAEKHFGPLEAEHIESPKPRDEPEQFGEKRVTVEAPAKEPYLLIGYKTPSIGNANEPWEPYALEVLASVLDGGSSARLERELVRGTRVAAGASAGYSAFTRLPGMLVMSGTPAEGRSVGELEQALLGEIERLRDEPVDAAELERVRNQVIASKVYELDSVFYQAMQIGLLESVGLDWRLVDGYVDQIARVTPEQVQSVARRYLSAENRTVGVLDPQPLGDEPVASARTGGHSHVIR